MACRRNRGRRAQETHSRQFRNAGRPMANGTVCAIHVTGKRGPRMKTTVRLTMAQALVRYLAALRVHEKDQPLFGGVFAIFGHGNVAGLGEALYAHRKALPTYRAHNEQAMSHAAIAYAKTHMRRRMMACTTSI